MDRPIDRGCATFWVHRGHPLGIRRAARGHASTEGPACVRTPIPTGDRDTPTARSWRSADPRRDDRWGARDSRVVAGSPVCGDLVERPRTPEARVQRHASATEPPAPLARGQDPARQQL